MVSDFFDRDVVLWGARGHALVLAVAIQSVGGRVIALIDNDFDVVPALPKVPLLHGEEGLAELLAERTTTGAERLAALVAIGGGRGTDRRTIGAFLAEVGLDLPAFIHPRAFVCDGVKVGLGSQVLAMASLAAGVRVGSGCIVNHCASVDHECYLGDGTHVAPGATLCGLVETGEDVFVGAGAVVLPRVRLGRGSTVGAGATVTEDVPAGCTVIGVPAHPINKRGELRQ